MRALRNTLLAVVLVPALQAYDVDLDSGGYALAWEPGSVPMRIMVPAPPSALIDGSTYAGSIQSAMQIWNNQLGIIQFSSQAFSPGNYESGNGLNEIAMDSQYKSGDTRKDFGTNTLAITVTYTQGNSRVESDLVFNTAFTWNSYRGNQRSGQQDIQRVALHELGHTLGLGHPDEVGQSVSAIMNSRVSNIDGLQADDIAGAQLFYGLPGFVPANNNFASATVINPGSSAIQLTGTNIAATKQTGEPSHAGANAPNGHSVWWRWTAPASGGTTITTLGSNFDTALAVYTGSAVSSLTSIAANDDAEAAVPGVDNPNRLRTSTVTFNAASGTTYSIAVDGWGSTGGGDQFTYTGAITLNLNFAGTGGTAPPSFTLQPASQTVTAGNSVTFTAAASGTPAPTYQWQKNNVAISGATGGSYTIATTNAASAGSYTVVATNSAGSVTSNVALLSVVVPPGGAIITISVE